MPYAVEGVQCLQRYTIDAGRGWRQKAQHYIIGVHDTGVGHVDRVGDQRCGVLKPNTTIWRIELSIANPAGGRQGTL